MQQNFGIEIPRSQTIIMGSNASSNIAQMLHEEIVRLIVLDGFGPEGSEPITDEHLIGHGPRYACPDPTWSELFDRRVAA